MDRTSHAVDIDALVVDASRVQAAIVVRALEALGVVSVRVAGSGGEALEAMRQQLPTVVISSLYLPDMSGTDLVQTMRGDRDLEAVAFVLVSSETRREQLEGVRQSGVCGILPKPFELAQLRVALEATLELMTTHEETDTAFNGDQVRVLLVDDTPSARKFMRRVLESLGFTEIVEAGNGREAVALLSELMVDLIVTDYNMPEMDGRELIAFVRERSWQRSVPILMVTSESNSARLAAVHEAGVSGICDKPFAPETVRGLLQRMLAERLA